MIMNLNMKQTFGAAALLLGVVLLVIAYRASNAPIDQLSNTLTGRYTDQTMWYLLIGTATAIAGGALVFFGKRTS